MNLFYNSQGHANRHSVGYAPQAASDAISDPRGYIADEGLEHAVNVALLLGQPLLLTGGPGSGKTQLAYSIAHQLGLGRPLRFDTKSTSTARDLFYQFDHLARFHAAQTGVGSSRALDHITFSAFGRAILFANAPETVSGFLPKGMEHPGQCRSIVLVDEVDKANRDFPNDLLAELEHMFFYIPELDIRVEADRKLTPIVVLTSNSEKQLPDAFLRRCVYYHIPAHNRERLEAIVSTKLKSLAGSSLAKSALDLYEHLRGAGLRREPSTAELLNWLTALSLIGVDLSKPLKAQADLAFVTLSALVKSQEDQERARQVVSQCLNQ